MTMFGTPNETASDLMSIEVGRVEKYVEEIQGELYKIKRKHDRLRADYTRLWEWLEDEKKEIVKLIHMLPPCEETPEHKTTMPPAVHSELLHAEHKLDEGIGCIHATLDWIEKNRADLAGECKKHRQSLDEKSAEVRQLIRDAYE